MTEITLPWPPKELSPNARVHWAAKSRAVKKYRHDCYIACRQVDLTPPDTESNYHLWIDFYPPTNHNYDADNCLSRIKSGIDGIADYLGIDDKHFQFHPWVKTKVHNGCVKVRITGGPKA